jgi:hypothetical protein
MHAIADQYHPASLACFMRIMSVFVMMRWRNTANFSSRKNPSKPASKQANKERVSAFDSNASGSACSKDVDNIMPTDRLTMRSTILVSSENEKMAAAEMLNTPAIAVVKRMDNSVE